MDLPIRRRWLGPAVAAGISLLGGCRSTPASVTAPHSRPILEAGSLLPSPRLIIGRIAAIDAGQQFAFIELAGDAPSAALVPGTELNARTLELRDTGKVQVSPYRRGRTLGTKIVEGQPSPGDEVVWLAP